MASIGDGADRGASLVAHPLTVDRWTDVETLFGPRGVCGGCWCMMPRLGRAEYEAGKGHAHREAMRAIVEGGEVPGLLGYLDTDPVAWCAVGPRDRYPWLSRSRILRSVDDQAVWSIVCLFVHRARRRRGLSRAMIGAACDHVRRCGGRLVEAYPVDARRPTVPPVFAWTGLASAYARAGFHEVARRSPGRPIVRCRVAGGANERR